MLRIQLVVEDYAELMTLSTLLKKVGFDVESTQHSLGLNDALLGLNPDVLIMTAFGRKLPGFELSKQLKKNRGLPHVILLHETTQPTQFDPGIEAWVPTPTDVPALLKTIARVCTLNETVLLEKYRAKMASSPDDERIEVKGAATDGDNGRLGASTLSDEARRERYRTYLSGPKPARHGLDASTVREQVRALRQTETDAPEPDLEKERRDFVTHLFRRK